MLLRSLLMMIGCILVVGILVSLYPQIEPIKVRVPNPTECFASIDNAAINGLTIALSNSNSEFVEYSGAVVKVTDDCYAHTEVVTNNSSIEFSIAVLSHSPVVAIFHTHPKLNEKEYYYFSERDVITIRELKVDSYVGAYGYGISKLTPKDIDGLPDKNTEGKLIKKF